MFFSEYSTKGNRLFDVVTSIHREQDSKRGIESGA